MTTNGTTAASGQFQMDSRSALRTAWVIWITALLLPLFAGLLLTAVMYMSSPARPEAHADRQDFAGTGMVFLLAFLAITTVAAFALRRIYFFQPYYEGESVPPTKYLWGMILIWLPFVITTICSILLMLLSGQLMPSIVPAGLAVVLLITQYPRGSAMYRPVGNIDDPSTYEEPA